MNSRNKRLLIAFSLIISLIVGYWILDEILSTKVDPQTVNDDGLQATFFCKKELLKRPTVLIIGGGDWGDYWGQTFAQKDYAAMSIRHYGAEGLPEKNEEIPLEYFEKAILWLLKQPQVDPEKTVVMGASRNAELALLIASTYPNLIQGAIAFSPSSVSWSNKVLPWNSDQMKPSCTLGNQPVPFIPMEKIKGNGNANINTLSYWVKGLSDSAKVNQAAIKVERITGPILLLSGKDDKVWPSALMSNMIEERLKKYHFDYTFENIQFDKAGHLISANAASSNRTGIININGKDYNFEYGGTEEGDQAAQRKALVLIFEYLSKL